MRRRPSTEGPAITKRIPLALASLLVMVACFAATTWLLRGPESGAAPRAATAPGLHRDAPQSVAAPPPPRASAAGAASPDDDAFVAAARAADRAEEAARADLVAAVTSVDESLELRLDRYLAALERALDASGDAAMLAHRGVWTEHFLRIDAVQTELAAMSPGARARALDSIRRRMGYGDDEVARMAEIDAQREARWRVGLAYMEERERLEATFEGEPLEDELRHLRARTFGAAAKTIEREEAEGFLRFERPRVYGRN